MPIVVDSSVAACWALPDEFSELANAVLRLVAEEEMLVPTLFWHELRNILIVNERRGRLDSRQSSIAVELIGRLRQTIDPDEDGDAVMALARRHGLTAYDAAYLELATRLRLPLATLDTRLAAAAAMEGCAFMA
ncbi:MAG: type II toxin-antitoxin system VapC family toxin [Mesorhizobium sp.]